MRTVIRSMLMTLAVLLVAGAAVFALFALRSKPMPAHAFFRAGDPPVLVIAHQGGDGERPSNTMAAFRHAADSGVDVLEMDVHSTRDGTLVTIHDETVDRTSDGTGKVNDFSFVELQTLDAGYDWPTLEEESGRTDRPYRGQGITIPSLDEVFTEIPGYRMVIEIKQTAPSIVQPLCDLLREHRMETQVIVASFHPEPMHDFRQSCPEVATAALEEEVRLFFILSMMGLSGAYQPTAYAFQVPEYSGDFHIVTAPFVRNAAAANVAVQPWTINSAEQMERMIGLGVNGIMTDYPTRLLELLDRD